MEDRRQYPGRGREDSLCCKRFTPNLGKIFDIRFATASAVRTSHGHFIKAHHHNHHHHNPARDAAARTVLELPAAAVKPIGLLAPGAAAPNPLLGLACRSSVTRSRAAGCTRDHQHTVQRSTGPNTMPRKAADEKAEPPKTRQVTRQPTTEEDSARPSNDSSPPRLPRGRPRKDDSVQRAAPKDTATSPARKLCKTADVPEATNHSGPSTEAAAPERQRRSRQKGSTNAHSPSTLYR
ncbi:hypothetical protein HPB50_028003 [Hyalomma asiaticum]|nr:hypothetical protein HPB50_028003 [Hyalomma asiaticum]